MCRRFDPGPDHSPKPLKSQGLWRFLAAFSARRGRLSVSRSFIEIEVAARGDESHHAKITAVPPPLSSGTPMLDEAVRLDSRNSSHQGQADAGDEVDAHEAQSYEQAPFYLDAVEV